MLGTSWLYGLTSHIGAMQEHCVSLKDWIRAPNNDDDDDDDEEEEEEEEEEVKVAEIKCQSLIQSICTY